MNKNCLRKLQSKKGFTLIELLVVVLIIGILAAIAVPQYFKVVEKGKAAESLTTLDSIRGAEERYLAKVGNYCTAAIAGCTANGWDMTMPTLKYFTIPATFAAGTSAAPAWKMTLTRSGSIPAVYGAYTVAYDAGSSGQPTITCTSAGPCQTDLMPN